MLCQTSFPVPVIPEVDARDVTVEHVRSAVWNHGSLIVRGLVGPERVTQLVADIDAALAGLRRRSRRAPRASETSRWYRPFAEIA